MRGTCGSRSRKSTAPCDLLCCFPSLLVPRNPSPSRRWVLRPLVVCSCLAYPVFHGGKGITAYASILGLWQCLALALRGVPRSCAPSGARSRTRRAGAGRARRRRGDRRTGRVWCRRVTSADDMSNWHARSATRCATTFVFNRFQHFRRSGSRLRRRLPGSSAVTSGGAGSPFRERARALWPMS